jgi:adenylosuccinate lyase
MNREDAYALVQGAAMETWDTGIPFRTTLRKHAITGRHQIDDRRLDEVCRPERYTERLRGVFERLQHLT